MTGVKLSLQQQDSISELYPFVFDRTLIQDTGTLHFKVYDQDMGVQGDFLGSCQLLVPRKPTKLKKETLFLTSVPSSFFSKPPSSRITVFYHVVERLEDQPDLVQLARRMGDEGSEEKNPKNMTVRCYCLQVSYYDFPRCTMQITHKSPTQK